MHIRGSFDRKATFSWEECCSSAGSDDGHAGKPIFRNCSKGEIISLELDDAKFMRIIPVSNLNRMNGLTVGILGGCCRVAYF